MSEFDFPKNAEEIRETLDEIIRVVTAKTIARQIKKGETNFKVSGLADIQLTIQIPSDLIYAIGDLCKGIPEEASSTLLSTVISHLAASGFQSEVSKLIEEFEESKMFKSMDESVSGRPN